MPASWDLGGRSSGSALGSAQFAFISGDTDVYVEHIMFIKIYILETYLNTLDQQGGTKRDKCQFVLLGTNNPVMGIRSEVGLV